MSQPVLVRGFQSKWWIILLRVLGFGALAFGTVLYLQKNPAGGMPLLIVGGLIVLAVESIAFSGRRALMWVEDLGNGFAVTDRNGTRDYRDAQVKAASLERMEHASEGHVQSVTLRLNLWVDSEPAPVVMANPTKVGATDPLEPLRVRIFEQLKQRAETALERGDTVEGEGWKLSRMGLESFVGMERELYRREDFTAIDIHDRHICLWTKGELPSLKIPISSRNAHVMYMLLAPKIREREQPSQPPKEGLGRILFERRSKRATVIAMAFLAVIADLVGLAMLSDKETLGVGIGAFVVGAFLWVGFASCLVGVFRCQEYGVYQKGLTGERQLRYTDVASFRYLVVRHYQHGVYTGTHFTFDFTPDPTSQARPISHSVSLNKADESLNDLANHISAVIAGKMLQKLKADERVPWTKNLAFVPNGIEFRPAGWIRRGEAVVLPYENIHGFDLQAGTFHLWQRGTEKSVMQESTGEHNFMPGYFLLTMLTSPPEPQPAAETASP